MSGNKSIPMNEFLKNCEKELQSYESISEKNRHAIQQLEHNISSAAATACGSLTSKDVFDKFLQVKEETVLRKLADTEKKSQMMAMSASIKKKEKVVIGLEKKLKALTKEYEKLKIEKVKEAQEGSSSIKIFKSALNYYTKYFQFIIEEGSADGDDKFCAIITFILEGKRSEYPIWFVFDKEIDSLISFNAGELLDEKQHEILHQRFKESNNYPALFCTLRHAAIKKHKS